MAKTIDATDRALDRENNLVDWSPIEGRSQSCVVIEMVVDLIDNKIYVLVNKKLRTFREISVLSTAHKECGCHYFSMEVSETAVDNSSLKKDDLVCGLLCQYNHFPSYFYAVLMNWTELTEYGTGPNRQNSFILPRATQFQY